MNIIQNNQIELRQKEMIAADTIIQQDLDTRMNTVASSVLLNQSNLSESVIKDVIEIDDETTADYTVDTIIQNGSSGIIYVCVTDSTSGELLTNTDYFSIDTTNVLSVTGGIFTYTNGVDGNGYIRSSEQVTQSIDFAGVSDGLKWVGKKLDGSGYIFEDRKPSVGLYEKQFADDNRLVFDVESGKHYTTTGGELITNGTFDTDTSGWTAINDANLFIDSGRLAVNADTTDYPIAVQTLNVEVGVSYKVRIGEASGTSPAVQMPVEGVRTNVYDGDIVTFSTTSTYINLCMYGTGDDDTAYFDDISVYKLEPTLDQELSTPVSFLPNPVMVASETPMDIREDSGSLASNVMESLEVDKDTKARDIEAKDEFRGKNTCTAWVKFNSSDGNVVDSYGITGVIRDDAGDYTITFAQSVDLTEAAVGMSTNRGDGANGGHMSYYVESATKLHVYTFNADSTSKVDHSNVSVQIFGGKN